MMSCDKVIQGLWEFLDKELTTESLADFQKHIDLCRSCFSRVEFEVLLRANCKDKTNHMCPDALKIKLKKIIELY